MLVWRLEISARFNKTWSKSGARQSSKNEIAQRKFDIARTQSTLIHTMHCCVCTHCSRQIAKRWYISNGKMAQMLCPQSLITDRDLCNCKQHGKMQQKVVTAANEMIHCQKKKKTNNKHDNDKTDEKCSMVWEHTHTHHPPTTIVQCAFLQTKRHRSRREGYYKCKKYGIKQMCVLFFLKKRELENYRSALELQP